MNQAAWAPPCNCSAIDPQPPCPSPCAYQLSLLKENPTLSPHWRPELCSLHSFLPAHGSRLLNSAALSPSRSPMIIPFSLFPFHNLCTVISPARRGKDGQRSHRDTAAYLALFRTTYLNQGNSWSNAGKKQLFLLLCRKCSLCCGASIPSRPWLLLTDTVAQKCIGQEGSTPRPIHQHLRYELSSHQHSSTTPGKAAYYCQVLSTRTASSRVTKTPSEA